MLKKLFIYEWKSSWKLETIFCGIILLLTFVGAIAFSNNVWSNISDNSVWMAFFIMYVILFYFSIMALALFTSIYFFIRFYKNYYTDEGYLMHTLPVKPSQLIISKALVMGIWQIISTIIIVFATLVLVFSVVSGMEGVNLWRELAIALAEIPWNEIEFSSVIIIIISIFASIGSFIFSIFYGYTAISLGQFSKKHKILASIGIYLAMNVGLQIIFTILQVIFMLVFSAVDIENISVGLIIAVFSLVTIIIYMASFGLYCLNKNIMQNKLNLD